MALSSLVGCALDLDEPDAESRGSAPVAPATSELQAVPSSRLCVTEGRVDTAAGQMLKVNVGGMRGVIAGDASRSAEVSFDFHGASAETAPLASGELRRQIGLKLRAKDTCNVVYVMWRAEASPTIRVAVKHNPGMSRHEQCGAGGYLDVAPRRAARAPTLAEGGRHTLHADLVGEELRVVTDGVVVWEGVLPAAAWSFDGPAGVRSDNLDLEFELRVPGGASGPTCPPAP
jgi:hypothetical protein